MWRYNDSESETSSSHCNYCGQTCANRRHLKDDLGVCNRCSRVLSHLTDTGDSNNSTMRAQAEVKAASSSVSATEEAAVASSDVSETVSIPSEGGDANDQDEEEDANDQDEEEDANDQDEEKVAYCPRCWKNPPTTKLYDVPICQGCLREANKQKELPAEKRKRRYQPPSPHLEEGKRLTRVCATCRQRRKRCPHRRVVDKDDPEADPRSKKPKVVAKKPDSDEEEDEESESTLAPAPGFTPVQKREVSEETSENINEDVNEDVDEDADEEVSRLSSQSSMRGNPRNVDDYDCDETMKGAIRDSITNVLGKEAEDLISSVEEKLNQATQGLKSAKKVINRLAAQKGRRSRRNR